MATATAAASAAPNGYGPTYSPAAAQVKAGLGAQLRRAAQIVKEKMVALWRWIQTKARLGWARITQAARWVQVKTPAAAKVVATKARAAGGAVRTGVVTGAGWVWTALKWVARYPLKWLLLAPWKTLTGLLVGSAVGIGGILLAGIQLAAAVVIFPAIVGLAIGGRFLKKKDETVAEAEIVDEGVDIKAEAKVEEPVEVEVEAEVKVEEPEPGIVDAEIVDEAGNPVDESVEEPVDEVPQGHYPKLTTQQESALMSTAAVHAKKYNEADADGDKDALSESAGRQWVIAQRLETTEIQSVTHLVDSYREYANGELTKKGADEKFNWSALKRGIEAQLSEMDAIIGSDNAGKAASK